MLGGFGEPPPLDELPIPPGEDELRDVICARERESRWSQERRVRLREKLEMTRKKRGEKRTAAIFAARLGGILSGPPPGPRTPCLSALAEPAPPTVGGFLGADPGPTAAGADARGLSAGGGPGEAWVALTGDCTASGEAVVGEAVDVDVDVDGAGEEDAAAGCCSSETAPTRCSSCCTLLLSAIPVALTSSRASPSGSDRNATAASETFRIALIPRQRQLAVHSLGLGGKCLCGQLSTVYQSLHRPRLALWSRPALRRDSSHVRRSSVDLDSKWRPRHPRTS